MTLDNKKYVNATALSIFYWDIKTDDYTQVVKWDFVAKMTPFSRLGKQCNLCLLEKRFIPKNINNLNLPNKQNEFM